MIDSHPDELAAQQPNARMCFACGLFNEAGLQMKFFNDGPNACRAEVILHDQHQGFPGIAHGGVVAAILDEAMGRAALSGDPNRLMYTAKMETRFRQHVPLHQKMIVSARIEKDRGRLATAAGQLQFEDGKIAAEATCTLVAIPQEELAQIDRELAGWQVYP